MVLLPHAAVTRIVRSRCACSPAGFQRGLLGCVLPSLLVARTFSTCSPAASVDRQRPFAERIFAEILAELGVAPGLAAVGRDRDLLDAAAAVEGDALQHVSSARPSPWRRRRRW